MKGVIVQIGDQKSIVMFNNGKFGAINTRPEYQPGTVVSTGRSISKRLVAFVSAAACLVLAIALGTYLYLTPVGFIRVAVNPDIEFGYNRFEKVISVTPINADAVPIVASLDIQHKSIIEAYQSIMSALNSEGYLQADKTVSFIVVQDSLKDASNIQSELMGLTEPIKSAFNSDFKVRSAVLTQSLYNNMPEESLEPSQTDNSQTSTPASSSQTDKPSETEPVQTPSTQPSVPETSPDTSTSAPTESTTIPAQPSTQPPMHNNRHWNDWNNNKDYNWCW